MSTSRLFNVGDIVLVNLKQKWHTAGVLPDTYLSKPRAEVTAPNTYVYPVLIQDSDVVTGLTVFDAVFDTTKVGYTYARYM